MSEEDSADEDWQGWEAEGDEKEDVQCLFNSSNESSMHDGGLPTVPDFWNLSRRWLVITLIHTCRYRLGVYA